jgi:GNAT superfamily N-acetyltransferase
MSNRSMRVELVNEKTTSHGESGVVVSTGDLRPIYDTFDRSRTESKVIRVSICRNMEDLSIVFAIRASAYFTDEQHTFEKHFEGNDFSATHVIGWIGSEPVATLRIRYFAEFARIERIAVRPTHRRSRVAFKIVQAAFAFCRDKGYRRISGVARGEMVPFWSHFGGTVNKGREPIFIYGLEHYEMSIEFPPVEAAVGPSSHPLVLLRPEGRWHQSGLLDRPAAPAGAPAAPTPAAPTPAPAVPVHAPAASVVPLAAAGARSPRARLRPRIAAMAARRRESEAEPADSRPG